MQEAKLESAVSCEANNTRISPWIDNESERYPKRLVSYFSNPTQNFGGDWRKPQAKGSLGDCVIRFSRS